MNKKGYHKAVFGVFLLIVLSALFMYQFGTEREDIPGGVTGMVVHDEGYEVRPIQDVTKDFERAGWERVAND